MEMDTAVIEQRSDTRSDLAWPVSVWLPKASRFFNGKSVNISKGGVFIKTDIKFAIGKQIRLAIPGSKIRNNISLKGLIVRISTEGFGVKFDTGSDFGVGRD